MARTARKTDTSTNAVLYLRVSTQEQSMEGHSLPMQEARLRSYCAMRELTIVDMIIDAGVSGGITLEDREGGQRLLGLVKAGAVSHIVALKLDRLFRSCVDCLQTTGQWDKKGLALHLVDIGGQAVDSSSAMGRFFLTMMAGAAELEKNLIGERTAQALQHKKANGERVGTVMYGKMLAADGIHLEDNATEQDVIATAKIYAEHGLSFRKIAARLADEGYMSRTGKPFTPQAISNMLEEVA